MAIIKDKIFLVVIKSICYKFYFFEIGLNESKSGYMKVVFLLGLIYKGLEVNN